MVAEGLGGSDPPTGATLTPTNISVGRTVPAGRASVWGAPGPWNAGRAASALAAVVGDLGVAPAPARPPRRERVPCERPESARKLIERTGQGQATMSGRKPFSIPKPIREQVDRIVADFNQKIIKNPQCFYVPRYRGNDLYLDRHNYGSIGPIARLKYRGELTNWEFAIYKYSNNRYDPNDWFFPGVEQVEGTVEGAMKAGLAAYPLSDYNHTSTLGRVLSLVFGRNR